MLIKLHRIANGKDSTLGMLRIDDVFECFSLEDQYQEVKVKGETRIPPGKYEIKFRKEPSPMRERYRGRFDWFSYHLELQDVYGFSYIYIHSGNTDDHTNGCLLVGYQANKTTIGEYEIYHSVDAFRALYTKVGQALNAGEKVNIEIGSF